MSFAGIAAMPEPVRRYRDAYPGVTVELLYFRTQAQKIELARQGLDVSFLIGPFEHADFHTHPVLEEPAGSNSDIPMIILQWPGWPKEKLVVKT